jgi:hypothetical protein
MPRERDKNRKMFHRGHYEVIAARFREQVSRHVTQDGQLVQDGDYGTSEHYGALYALRDLAEELSARFAFDNEDFDAGIFMERCGFINISEEINAG